jgi:DNA-directed RNA polymerase specialized sigma24 family protein
MMGDTREPGSIEVQLLVPLGRLDVRSLFERRYGAMARLAGLLTGDEGKGEEIAQEAFAILYRRAEGFERPEEADAYLRTVVVNLTRSALRRSRLVRRHSNIRTGGK